MILTIKDPEVFQGLVSGSKKYEGRIWKEDYSHLKENSLILFILEGSTRMLIARVTEIRRYETLDEMIDDLWAYLLPGISGPAEAKEYYKRFYSLEEPGVAIGVEPVQMEDLDMRITRKWLGVDLPDRLRVAVGVDGEKLYEGHFGDAPRYNIYECNPDQCRLLEVRDNTTEEEHEEHGDHHGDPAKFRAILSLLRDTDVWCAFRMGPNYLRIVRESDKVPFLAGTRDLDTALHRLRSRYLEIALKRVCKWR